MPPSILKYLDVARLVGAGIKCPACNGVHCRHSRWHSKTEKLGSAGSRPYRCTDCKHRFLARNSASLERILINGTIGILLGFGIGAAVEYAHDAEETSTGMPVVLTATANSKASDDPATRALKQQDAAESGDVGAMLQLGRDLVTGNNHPKDYEQAAKWVQLAAATGHADAMFELGRFYRDGIGVTQDSARAHAWFTRAAAARHPDALAEREALNRTMSRDKLKEAEHLSLPTEPAAVLLRPK